MRTVMRLPASTDFADAFSAVRVTPTVLATAIPVEAARPLNRGLCGHAAAGGDRCAHAGGLHLGVGVADGLLGRACRCCGHAVGGGGGRAGGQGRGGGRTLQLGLTLARREDGL